MSKALKKLLGKRLVNLSTKRDKLVEELPHGTIVALFFSGNDKQVDGGEEEQDFGSRLLDFHKEIKEHKKGLFEVVQIPLEETKSASQTTQNSLPFFVIHGDNSRIIQEYLIRKFQVHTTTVILMDSISGSVINFKGKEKIVADPKGEDFPWRYPKCSEILASGHLIASNTSNPSYARHQLVNASQLVGSIKGLYFAAYWCPPCRTYVSLLQDVYKKIRSEQHHKFEIIFVSSDRSKTSFERLFANQPWLAVPFEDMKRREDLTTMFNIKGIPAFVLVDQDDNVITLDGRTEVGDDCEAVDFPWYPKPVEELRDRHSTTLNHDLCLIYFTGGNDDLDYDKAEEILSPIAMEYLNSDVEEASQPKFFIASDSEISESLRIFMDLDETRSYICAIHNSRYAIAGESQTLTEKQIKDFIDKFQNTAPELKCKYFASKFI